MSISTQMGSLSISIQRTKNRRDTEDSSSHTSSHILRLFFDDWYVRVPVILWRLSGATQCNRAFLTMVKFLNENPIHSVLLFLNAGSR